MGCFFSSLCYISAGFFCYRNGKRIQLQIWDTAGQERYQSITNAYFHTSMGVIVMFDLTDQESFEACRNW